jgi:hypothetical protein
MIDAVLEPLHSQLFLLAGQPIRHILVLTSYMFFDTKFDSTQLLRAPIVLVSWSSAAEEKIPLDPHLSHTSNNKLLLAVEKN